MTTLIDPFYVTVVYLLIGICEVAIIVLLYPMLVEFLNTYNSLDEKDE